MGLRRVETVKTNSNYRNSSFLARVARVLRSNLLLVCTVFSVVVGVALGFILRKYTKLNGAEKQYVGFPGELFIRMLKFIILPLIASSLISGMVGLGSHKAGRVASRAFAYYMSTTFLAAILGLVLVTLIKPGLRNKLAITQSGVIDAASTAGFVLNDRKISPIVTILDLVRNLLPDSIVGMTILQYESKMVPKYKPANAENATVEMPREIDYYQAVASERSGLNVLGLVMFCLTFGCVISRMERRQGRILADFFEAINDAFTRLIGIVMIFSPIGIGSLICASVLNMDNPVAVFERISYYMLTVLVGLFIHGFIVLPLIYVVFTRKNIFVYARNMFEALLVALATSSSNATLPVTFKCIEENNKIPKSISRFVLPVGATINMDGTALYEAIAAIFIAQLNNMDLKFVDLIVTSMTATVASIGAAGLPSAGLITMVIVLSALNLPTSHISLIYTVDWFLDRFRTIINVWGDCVGAGVVAHLCRDEATNYTDGDDEKNTDANIEPVIRLSSSTDIEVDGYFRKAMPPIHGYLNEIVRDETTF